MAKTLSLKLDIETYEKGIRHETSRVALMGWNDTGPPWSVTDDDDNRCQRSSLVWPSYTTCRLSNNKSI